MKKSIESKLGILVERFVMNKEVSNKYKKLVDADSSEIKELFAKSGEDFYEDNEYIAKVYTTVRESFDEDSLIDVLAKNKLDDCIKTVQVVDMDMLESKIFNNSISKSVLNKIMKCKITKEVILLKAERKKKGKK